MGLRIKADVWVFAGGQEGCLIMTNLAKLQNCALMWLMAPFNFNISNERMKKAWNWVSFTFCAR